MDRGQAEPLAAVVAVIALSLGFAMYMGAIDTTLPGTSDNEISGPTVESVWDDLQHQGSYVEADDSGPVNELEHDPEDAVDDSSLPRGNTVYVSITRADSQGADIVVAEAVFDETGDDVTPPPWEGISIPEDADRTTRPVGVQVEAGDVRGGTLEVVVW